MIEPDPEDYARPIEDGEMISPHGMDPQTVLRFVTAVGSFSGKVVVVGVRAGPDRGPRASASAPRSSSRSSARSTLVMEQIAELRTDEAYR